MDESKSWLAEIQIIHFFWTEPLSSSHPLFLKREGWRLIKVVKAKLGRMSTREGDYMSKSQVNCGNMLAIFWSHVEKKDFIFFLNFKVRKNIMKISNKTLTYFFFSYSVCFQYAMHFKHICMKRFKRFYKHHE